MHLLFSVSTLGVILVAVYAFCACVCHGLLQFFCLQSVFVAMIIYVDITLPSSHGIVHLILGDPGSFIFVDVPTDEDSFFFLRIAVPFLPGFILS